MTLHHSLRAAASNLDPYFDNVVMLLHGDGSNGAQNNTFIDSSSGAVTVTRAGTVPQGTFNPFKTSPLKQAYATSTFGGSAWFPGSTASYLTVPTSTSLLMTGDFTLECWVNIPSGTTQTSYSNIYNGAASPNQSLHSSFNGNGNFGFAGSSPSLNIATGVASADGAWHHLAVVRSGSTITMYVDGVSKGTATTSSNIDLGSATQCRIGAGANGFSDNPYRGYTSSLRIVKGTAVYTGNFTPPTTPLTNISGTSLLLNFTNAGVYDNAAVSDFTTVNTAQISTAQSKFGGSSIYFPGGVTYLYMPLNSTLDFGTSPFTIEFWMRTDGAQQTTSTIMDRSTNAPGTGATLTGSISNNTSGGNANKLLFNVGGVTLVSTTNPNSGSWVHVACVRASGTTAYLFINGVKEATSTSLNGATGFSLSGGRIGKSQVDDAAGNAYTGYIEELRMTKGLARYSADFLLPVTPYPSV